MVPDEVDEDEGEETEHKWTDHYTGANPNFRLVIDWLGMLALIGGIGWFILAVGNAIYQQRR